MKLEIISKKYGIKTIVIDDEDYNKIKDYKLHIIFCKKSKGFYARAYKKKTECETRKQYYLHRYLVDCPKGKITDHINGDSLDNRKQNLRICDGSENICNSGKRDMDSTSKYKGVSFVKKEKKWQAAIMKNKQTKFLGHFIKETDAAMAYNQAAIKYHGEFARLNEI